MPRQRVGRIDELEVVHHLREPIDLQRLEPERLADLARRASPAVGDDVGRHRRAEAAVFFVDVLDDALAPIAARQIEIDVGPFAPLFREEPLEQQIHPHRIDGRDPEAVAHGAVGRRPPALHEDVVLAAEIDDVPDDQEVAGEIELLDQIELARDLRAGAIGIRLVAFARADAGDLAQKGRLRVAGRHGIRREAIAEIGHRELQPIGQLGGAADRVRHIGEQRRHVRRRLQIPLRVRRQTPARVREIGVVVHAREHVEERPVGGRREPDAAGRERRHPEGRRQVDEPLVVGVFVAPEMPLHLDVGRAAAEHADHAIEQPADAVAGPIERRAADERHQTARRAVELIDRERALAFRRAQFHPRDQAAQVSVPVLAFAEHGQCPGQVGRVGLVGRVGQAAALASCDGSAHLPDLPDLSHQPYLPALAIVSSAPMIGFIPAARAAL